MFDLVVLDTNDIWLLFVPVVCCLTGVTLGVTTTSSLRSTMILDFWQEENEGIVSDPKGAISSLKQ